MRRRPGSPPWTGSAAAARPRRSAAMPSPSPRWTATRLPSVGVDQHPVVGLGAVEVEYHRVDVLTGREAPAPASSSGARARARARSCGSSISSTRAGSVRTSGGAAEEAVAGRAEAGGVHGVGGAGLQPVLRAVLATLAYGLVVVDAAAVHGVLRSSRQTKPWKAATVSALSAPCSSDGRGDTVQVLAGEERAGALHEQEHVDGTAVHGLVRVRGVQDGGLAGGGVAGDVGGPLDDLGAGGAGGVGDRAVVGGDDARRSPCRAARHSRTARATSGTPPTRARFLPGTPLEPPRAGITASTAGAVPVPGWGMGAAFLAGAAVGVAPRRRSWVLAAAGRGPQRPAPSGGRAGGWPPVGRFVTGPPAGGSSGRRAARRGGRRRVRPRARRGAAARRSRGGRRRRRRRAAARRRGRSRTGRGRRADSRVRCAGRVVGARAAAVRPRRRGRRRGRARRRRRPVRCRRRHTPWRAAQSGSAFGRCPASSCVPGGQAAGAHEVVVAERLADAEVGEDGGGEARCSDSSAAVELTVTSRSARSRTSPMCP